MDNNHKLDDLNVCPNRSEARIKVLVSPPKDSHFTLDRNGGLVSRHKRLLNEDASDLPEDMRLAFNCAALGWGCYTDEISEYLNDLSVNGLDISKEVTDLLEHVVMLKRNHKIDRLIAYSSIPKSELYAPFDSSLIRLEYDLDLWNLDWAESNASIFISGRPGTGKTSTAVQFAKRAILEKGYSVFRVCSTELFESFHDPSQAAKALNRASEVDLLILDDVGYEEYYSGNTAYLHKLLDYRMRSGLPTVIITQRGLEEWMNVFDNHDVFKAIMSKFFNKAYTLDFSGRSFYSG